MQKELRENGDLWRQFKEGSDHAFYLLYDQCADNLYRYGSHFTKDREFIKDCIQDLFLDLYKYRKKLSETDNVQFYLFRSLRRIIHKEQVRIIPLVNDEMNYARNDYRVFSREDELIDIETEAENSRILNEVMKGLSNRQRESLSLKFEHDLTYPEIAEIMDISVESARTLIGRALKELRKSIEHMGQSTQLLFFLCHYPNL